MLLEYGPGTSLAKPSTVVGRFRIAANGHYSCGLVPSHLVAHGVSGDALTTHDAAYVTHVVPKKRLANWRSEQ